MDEEKNKTEETEVIKETKKEKKDKEKDKIAKLHDEVNMWKDKYYRAFADLDNLRKQYQNDYAKSVKYQAQAIIEKILPSLDIFSMVIGSADKLSDEVRNYVMGFDVVYRQMLQALESEGMSEIVTKTGDKFNHDIHYAMDTVEVEKEEEIDMIMKVYQKGYKLHDRLLRPVTVCVGIKKKEEKENKENNEHEAQA